MKSIFALAALLLTACAPAQAPLANYTTSGAGRIYQGSGFPWQAAWSSEWANNGELRSLHMVATLGSVESIRCDSNAFASVLPDGSITAQGTGTHLGAIRLIVLRVYPTSPATASFHVYNYFTGQRFDYPLTVTTGSLITY